MSNLLWLSFVVLLVLIHSECDWARWSSVTSAGTGYVWSMWSLILQHSSPVHVCLDLGIQDRDWKFERPLETSSWNRHTITSTFLLDKASHNASRDSNGGEVDSTLFSLKKKSFVESFKHIQKRRAYKPLCTHHLDSTVSNSQLILFYHFLYNYSSSLWITLYIWDVIQSQIYNSLIYKYLFAGKSISFSSIEV